jgi:aquaporin Z
MKKYVAEFIGTFWLVFGGVGSAVFAAYFAVPGGGTTKSLGLGFLGVSLAFGLTVFTGAYAFGHISGGHFNPAVSFGLWAGKRFSGKELLPYIIAQVAGGLLAGLLILIIASGSRALLLDLSGSNPLATNGYGAHSPGGYNVFAALITEVVLTFIFLLIILGSTDHRAPAGFGPAAIGLGLTLIHLISIPITNTSVNPARSTGVALFAGNGEIIGQLWLFWFAPILGAVLAGYFYASFFAEPKSIYDETLEEGY